MTVVQRAIMREGVKKVSVYSINGEKVGEVRLPWFFFADRREDLVRRAYIHLRTHSLQPKGSWKGSAAKYSARSLGVGLGIARISRIMTSGTGKSRAGGWVPSAVGGRPTHPPVPEKVLRKDLNEKERRGATIAALAFTADTESVRRRGHRVPEGLDLPIVVEDGLESVTKSADFRRLLLSLGMAEELERASERKVRAGKGKKRGRTYKGRTGPLLVVSKDVGVSRAVRNLPGVDVVLAKDLSVLHLAPGGHPGRLTVFTASALSELQRRFGDRGPE
ncbi:MAG: 50S ribosomal protein L4 [Thaumarchaeota archaeon]|nr:50S ribosomal protein L4 [Candidatus Calditenuaceae archaeon]MDW8187194.1 50S ribosomal protein L4 [Nitrososphaerota archaeon]